MHAYTRTQTHSHTYAQMHACHTNMYTHKHTHTHTHTHTAPEYLGCEYSAWTQSLHMYECVWYDTTSNTRGACKENSTTSADNEDMVPPNTLLLSQFLLVQLFSAYHCLVPECTNHNTTFSARKCIDVLNDNQDALWIPKAPLMLLPTANTLVTESQTYIIWIPCSCACIIHFYMIPAHARKHVYCIEALKMKDKGLDSVPRLSTKYMIRGIDTSRGTHIHNTLFFGCNFSPTLVGSREVLT